MISYGANDDADLQMRDTTLHGSSLLTQEISEERHEAMSKVLNTIELLENILYYLPAESLALRARLVCKAFKHTVENSPSIQRRMFFLPDLNCDLKLLPYCLFDIKNCSTRRAIRGKRRCFSFNSTIDAEVLRAHKETFRHLETRL